MQSIKQLVHQFEDTKQYFGLLVEKPVLFRMNQLMKDVLDSAATHGLSEEALTQALQNKLDPRLIREALNDLTEILEKSNVAPNPPEEHRFEPTAFYVEVDEYTTSALENSRQAVKLLLSTLSPGRKGRIILCLRQGCDVSFLEEFYRFAHRDARRANRTLCHTLSIEWNSLTDSVCAAIEKCRCDVQLSLKSSLLSDPDYNHRISLIRRLSEGRVMSVRLGDNIKEASLLAQILPLSSAGVSIAHLRCGMCDLTQVPTEGRTLFLHRYLGKGSLGLSELTKYFGALYGILPAEFYCGAGKWYWAISSAGEIFPCHKFIGDNRFKAGDTKRPELEGPTKRDFLSNAVDKKPDCIDCWARRICGGGCAFSGLQTGGTIESIDSNDCVRIRGNIEFAAVLQGAMSESEKIVSLYAGHAMGQAFPHLVEPSTVNGGYAVLESKGESMRPLIEQGARLKLQFVPPRAIKVGDVFSYKNGDMVVTHRLLFKISRGNTLHFIEKGDNAFFAETTSPQVLGRVISISNPPGKQPILLDDFVWRFGSLCVVFATVTSWLLYFLARYGFAFVVQLLAARFDVQSALKKTIERHLTKKYPPSFAKVVDSTIQSLVVLLLATYRLKEALWKSSTSLRRFTNSK